MDGTAAEAKLIGRGLPAAQCDSEPYQVHSEAQPSLKNLSLAICPIGVTIYQQKTRFEVYGWTEIWNAGYSTRCFWIRIFRDGEQSKHKYNLTNCKNCKAVWKVFKQYFKFYTKDHSIQPKVAWGRVAPTVNRSNFNQSSSTGNQILSNINNSIALSSGINQALLLPAAEL